MKALFRTLAVALSMSLISTSMGAENEYDIVVYGGTSGAITAAVQAKKMGHSVVVVSPDKHLGGLSSGGLGWTDTGNKTVIGGLARQFYQRVYAHYDTEEAWKQQKKEEYGNRGQGTRAADGETRTMWIFEPHVAEAIFDGWVEEHGFDLLREERLDRGDGGVTVVDGKITAIKTLSGKTFTGKVFIDGTYEGDLLAAAGISYHVGREANSVYGENWNGVQTGVLHHGHHFGVMKVDPYVVPGDPSSGVLPRITTETPNPKGEGDAGVQAYCFRACFTNAPENRIPFPKPEGYDPGEYALVPRILEAGWPWKHFFNKFDPLPNHKTDTNNHGPFSFDNIGMNHDYPEASYERREEIIAEHETYQQGLLYFLANDPSMPEELRARMSEWGLPKDEFTDNGGWSHQLYIREARRMVGDYVMTEFDCKSEKETPESIGMGSYTIDSHNIQRYITPEGYVQNEGDIGVGTGGPYKIAYGALVPKKEECTNLYAPVAASASHIAYGSIRMEPVFMIMGQSAATAASMAINEDIAVQDVDYTKLRERLLADGQILEYDGPRSKVGAHSNKGIPITTFKGIIIDNTIAKSEGSWKASSTTPGYIGLDYAHDDNQSDAEATITFSKQIENEGTYVIRFGYVASGNRASNAAVKVSIEGEEVYSGTVNQKEKPEVDGHWTTLSEQAIVAGSTVSVTVSGKDADGFVTADAVQILEVE